MNLPWRPEHGKVVRMFSDVTYPSGGIYECDTRYLLKKAIKDASETLGGWRLTDCDLYVTMEPCIMCSGAIVNSRIKNIIIGTKHIKNANIEKQHTFKMEYFKDSRVNVEFGIMEDECSIILQRFFKT